MSKDAIDVVQPGISDGVLRLHHRKIVGYAGLELLPCELQRLLIDLKVLLRHIDLVNFKVRILDEAKGTGAVTRVLLDTSDGEDVWGTIGVSENIIESSWEALVDSLEYGMLRVEQRAGRGTTAPTT